MKNIKTIIKTFLSLLIILSSAIYSQSKDPDIILNRVKEKFSSIKDYQVDVNIKIDVSFLKVPETKARIFYKSPDKIHIESKGFALLPKGALDFSPLSLMKGNYTALYDREEDIDGIKTTVVKTIPIGESSDVILSTFWVDQKLNILRKVEISTKVNGTFIINLKYDSAGKNIQLPEKMIFEFNISKLNIPKRFTTEDSEGPTDSDAKKSQMGMVVITYSNYEINKGIPDSLFEKVEKKGKSRLR